MIPHVTSSHMSMAELDGASLPELTAYLHSDDPAVRADAACSIGDRLRSREIDTIDASLQGALAKRLHDDVFEVAFEAAMALAEVQNPAAFAVLLRATRHRTWRLDAVRALGTLGDKRAIAPLTRMIQRWWLPWADKLQAGAALCALGDPAGAAFLRGRLSSRRSAERAAAIHFIGESRHPEACHILLGIVADTQDPMRDSAVRSLGLLRDGRARVPLEEALRQAEGELAQDLLETLTKLPNGC